jgi:hypothetical protein
MNFAVVRESDSACADAHDCRRFRRLLGVPRTSGNPYLFSIAPSISWNPVEGELALFDARTGAYHALNPGAATIWRAIASGMNETQAIDAIAEAHDAPREIIAANVRDFIADALAKGLLQEDPA